jgi:hypothetical protein
MNRYAEIEGYSMKLHDTQPHPLKRKNVSPLRVIVNKWGFLLGGLMLGLGVIVGLAASLFVVPPVLGFDLTSTALAEREIMLAATDADLVQRDRDAVERETQFALNAQATSLDLFNAESLLDQTATQSANYIMATNTANAVADVRQRTQIALDHDATQVQLQTNATEAQLDFQNTQAALSGQGGGFNAQSLQVTVNPTATSIPPTPTSTIMLPPPSNTPAADISAASVESDLRAGFDTQNWRDYGNAWEAVEQGLQAVQNNAVLLSNDARWADDFTLTVEVAPAIVLESTYTLLLNIVAEDVLAVRIHTSGLAADRIELVQLRVDFQDGFQFLSGFGTVLAEVDVESNVLLTSKTRFSTTIADGTVIVTLNDTEILSAELPANLEAGQVGVILPQGSILQSISVQENE